MAEQIKGAIALLILVGPFIVLFVWALIIIYRALRRPRKIEEPWTCLKCGKIVKPGGPMAFSSNDSYGRKKYCWRCAYLPTPAAGLAMAVVGAPVCLFLLAGLGFFYRPHLWDSARIALKQPDTLELLSLGPNRDRASSFFSYSVAGRTIVRDAGTRQALCGRLLAAIDEPGDRHEKPLGVGSSSHYGLLVTHAASVTKVLVEFDRGRVMVDSPLSGLESFTIPFDTGWIFWGPFSAKRFPAADLDKILQPPRFPLPSSR